MTTRGLTEGRRIAGNGTVAQLDPWLMEPCAVCGATQYLRASERRRCSAAVVCAMCSARALRRSPR